ncbi:unnamed protein product [Euphydryas editha]|uniref:Uncharacterized protein n=1 Tax=Euphydryas editha TaxID=104508 RepID=A0AAU9UG09_EUPED|nr:unnamed protein product [Euphydryas editha]
MTSEKETGVTDKITISIDNSDGEKNDSEIKMAGETNNLSSLNTNGTNCKDLLGVPRQGHRMSFMEEESLKERMRLSLLKQCSAILKQGDERYTKESLHRAFQDEVCF